MINNIYGNGYRSLNSTEQKCYNDIVGLIESYQTEWTFSQLSFDFVSKVYKTVLADHPEFFWLTNASEGTTSIQGNRSTLFFRPEFNCNAVQIRTMRQQFTGIVESLINNAMRHSYDLYERILYLHDCVVVNTDYVLNSPHCYDAYGCLVLRRAVCAGYAAAFQVLMQRLGVECGRVSGRSSSARTGEVNHEWNYIRLSDGYYYVDVTWDDPLMDNGATTDNLSHDFFCIDIDELRLTHKVASNQFIPKVYGTRFNYYKYMGWYLDRYSFSAVCSIAEPQLRCADKFYIKFKSRRSVEEAKRDLIDANKVFSIPGIQHQRIAYNISKSGLVFRAGRSR